MCYASNIVLHSGRDWTTHAQPACPINKPTHVCEISTIAHAGGSHGYGELMGSTLPQVKHIEIQEESHCAHKILINCRATLS